MSKIKYCPLCKREVQVRAHFSWLIFIILLCIGLLPGVIYWLVFHKKKCPICGYKF